MNRLRCKLAQIVHGAGGGRETDQPLGLRGQRSRSPEAEIGHKNHISQELSAKF